MTIAIASTATAAAPIAIDGQPNTGHRALTRPRLSPASRSLRLSSARYVLQSGSRTSSMTLARFDSIADDASAVARHCAHPSRWAPTRALVRAQLSAQIGHDFGLWMNSRHGGQ